LKQFSDAIINRRKLITVLFLIFAVIGAVLMNGVPVEYSFVSYLPPTAESTQAIKKMGEEFPDPVQNARVMLKDVTITQALEMKQALLGIDGVNNAVWLDDVSDVNIPIEFMAQETVENYYKDGSALISLTVDTTNVVSTIDSIYDLIGETGAVDGDAVYNYSGQAMAGGETRNAMIIAIPLILVILLLSTSSWLQPLLFLCAIGVAVLINAGINFFTGSISFVTSSVSPILQMAVSMDYAIFLVHAFEEFREKTDDAKEAMKLAISRAMPAIAASALTTLFGFLALCFMNFRIGLNLGINLVKGVALSYLSVVVFLPALTICCLKIVDKARHKIILPPMVKAGAVLSKVRVPMLIIAVVAAVPCLLAQDKNTFSYGTGGYDPGSRQYRDEAAIEEVFGASAPLVIIVPRGDTAREALLVSEIEEMPHITGVVSYVSTVGAEIPIEIAGSDVSALFYSDRYARIIAYTDTAEEGDAAFRLVESVRTAVSKYYDESYTTGAGSVLYDVKQSVESDRTLITALAIILCAIVIFITFRSVLLPVILCLIIEIAVWINMSFNYFTDSPLMYIGFLIISTVQLGATIDYAILYTDRFRLFRQDNAPAQAAYLTYGETFRSTLISGATLSFAGIALSLASTNPVVQTLGLLLTRGTILSFILVNTALPAALILLDKAIQKTSFSRRYIQKTDNTKSDDNGVHENEEE